MQADFTPKSADSPPVSSTPQPDAPKVHEEIPASTVKMHIVVEKPDIHPRSVSPGSNPEVDQVAQQVLHTREPTSGKTHRTALTNIGQNNPPRSPDTPLTPESPKKRASAPTLTIQKLDPSRLAVVPDSPTVGLVQQKTRELLSPRELTPRRTSSVEVPGHRSLRDRVSGLEAEQKLAASPRGSVRRLDAKPPPLRVTRSRLEAEQKATPSTPRPQVGRIVPIEIEGQPVITMRFKPPAMREGFEDAFRQWFAKAPKEGEQKQQTENTQASAEKLKPKEGEQKQQIENAKGPITRKRFSDKAVNYSADKVELAIKAFKECKCNFAYMKHHHFDLIDVISDMRAFELDNILEELQKEKGYLFNEIDRGSPEPQSDRDISIRTRDRAYRNQEVEFVEEFNKRFQERWGQSSARVFDSNLYTHFYLESYVTPEVREQQLKQQTKMSLVMFRINSELSRVTMPSDKGGPRQTPWDALKESLSPEMRAEVEREYDEVVLERSKEVLRLGAGDRKIDTILKEKKEVIINLANRIVHDQPDIAVQASNNLHHKIREQAKIYFDRFEAVQQLFFAKSKDDFVIKYQKAVDAMIAANSDQLAEKLDELRAKGIPVDELLAKETPEDELIAKGISKEDQRLIKTLKTRITIWERKKKEIPDLTGQEDFFKENAGRNPDELHIKSETPFGKHLLEIFGQDTDKLLLKMQDIDAKGRCHAQETHISEGAYAFTVLDIQEKGTGLRTAGHYREGINELSAFFYSHQAHFKERADKMIESSKYVFRMEEAITRLEKRAKQLGKELPKLTTDQKNLLKYFKDIYPLRKNKFLLPSEADIRQSLGVSEDIDKVNSEIIKIVSQINAWADKLSPQELMQE